MGFSLFLIVSCLTGGVAWGTWKLHLRQAPLAQAPLWVELGRRVFLVFLFIIVVRSFVVEPYRIPSGSMMPTLVNGDFIVVKKYSYALTLPVIHTQLIALDRPQRGDVVAFRKPGEENLHYIKRVVGLPGDRLTYRDRFLSINGEPVPLRAVSEDVNEFGQVTMQEGLGATEHPVLHFREPSGETVDWFEETVPKGHYFMMGDNRDDSRDSRDPDVGFVPYVNLVGQATHIWMNLDALERIGNQIK